MRFRPLLIDVVLILLPSGSGRVSDIKRHSDGLLVNESGAIIAVYLGYRSRFGLKTIGHEDGRNQKTSTCI